MQAIEEHEPFGGEAAGSRVLRNDNTIRNRVKREGRREATRVASHQMIYNGMYFACRKTVQLSNWLTNRVVRYLPIDLVKPITTPGGRDIHSDVVTPCILVLNDALCAVAQAIFDGIGDEFEDTLQTTTPIGAGAPRSNAMPASSPLRTPTPASPVPTG